MTTIDRKSSDLKLVEPARGGDIGECLPSTAGEISALASANAPILYFDAVSFCSADYGIGGITLSAARQINNLPGRGVISDRVIVVHLRGSLRAMLDLRAMIDEVERMVTRQAEAAVAAAEADETAARLPN